MHLLLGLLPLLTGCEYVMKKSNTSAAQLVQRYYIRESMNLLLRSTSELSGSLRDDRHTMAIDSDRLEFQAPSIIVPCAVWTPKTYRLLYISIRLTRIPVLLAVAMARRNQHKPRPIASILPQLFFFFNNLAPEDYPSRTGHLSLSLQSRAQSFA
jgi:hypothetical protein